MFCAKCGAGLSDDAKKCFRCGAPVRIRPAARTEEEELSWFSIPEEQDMPVLEGLEESEERGMPEAREGRGRQEKRLGADTLSDPVFFKNATDEVDVKEIMRIARGEGAGTEPGAGSVSGPGPEAAKDGGGKPEDAWDSTGSGARYMEESGDAFLSGEDEDDYGEYEREDLPQMEKAYRRLSASHHARAEAAEEKAMAKHILRAKKHYDRLEDMADQLRKERAARAEKLRQRRILQDAAWKEQRWFEEALRAEIAAEQEEEQRRREELARAEEERRARELERAKAEEERRAREAERIRAEAAMRAEPAQGREEAGGQAMQSAQEAESARTGPVQRAGYPREEAADPARRVGGPLAAQEPARRGSAAPAAGGDEEALRRERAAAGGDEEALRRERAARAARRAREDEQDGLERFLGKYGLSREAAVRLATLFLIALLGMLYVLGLGRPAAAPDSGIPAEGVNGAPALAEPDAGGLQEEEDAVPTGGGDFGNARQ